MEFLRNYLLQSFLFAAGTLWAIYGILSGSYGVATVGLPAAAWTSIGVLVFFGTVVTMLAQFDKRIRNGFAVAETSSGPPPSSTGHLLGYAVALFMLVAFGGSITYSFLTAPRDPQTIVDAIIKATSGYPVVDVGKETKIEVGAANYGDHTARRVKWHGEYRIIQTPSSSVEEAQFLDELSADVFHGLAGKKEIPVLLPGKDSYYTLSLSPSDRDVDEFRRGRKRLYVIVQIVWRDGKGTHELEACRKSTGENFAWADCDTHNTL